MQYFARKWLYFGEAHHAHPDGEGTIFLEQDFDIARTKKACSPSMICSPGGQAWR